MAPNVNLDVLKCPRCNTTFLQPTSLQRHLNRSLSCNLSNDCIQSTTRNDDDDSTPRANDATENNCTNEIESSELALKSNKSVSGSTLSDISLHTSITDTKKEMCIDILTLSENDDVNIAVNWLSKELQLEKYVLFQMKVLNELRMAGAPSILYGKIMSLIEEYLPLERRSFFRSQKSLMRSIWKIIDGPVIHKTIIKFESNNSTGQVFSFDAYDAIKLLLQHPHFQDFEKILVRSKDSPFEPYEPDPKYMQHMLDGNVWKRTVEKYSVPGVFIFPICLYSDTANITKNGSISVTPVVMWSPMIKREYRKDLSTFQTWLMLPNAPSAISEEVHSTYTNDLLRRSIRPRDKMLVSSSYSIFESCT